MSSISDRQKRHVVRFYEERIVPLATSPQASRLEPERTEGGASFFVVRARTRLERKDFEVRLADEAQVIETLEGMWAGTPLARIPRPLIDLCKHFPVIEEKVEVSGFVYEMF
jgi:hypothetical protein